jgi:hypothetical protein
MDKVYDKKLTTAERQKVEQIERFDEFEEWVLL